MQSNFKNLMKHKDVEVRRDAVKDLKKLKDKASTVSLLIKSLEDEDWRVRKTAIEILLEIRGETVIKKLISTLNREDNANARNSAIDALIALSTDATDYLIKAFKSSRSDVRKFIIDILGRTGNLKVLPFLLKVLKDKDKNVRTSAIEYLSNFRDISAVNALIPILKSGDIWLAYHAADALGRIGDVRAVDALIAILPQRDLRIPAIKALGQIAEVGSLSSIAPFLKDESKAVREETVKAIEQFFKKGVSEEIIVKNIKNIFGDEVINILVPYAQSDKKDIKTAATVLLGLLKDKNAIASLLEMSLEDPDASGQETIIRAIVSIGKAEPDYLIPFFNVSDPYQRRIVCDIAGQVGAPTFFNPLVSLLKDEDGHIRAKATIALSNLNNPEAVRYIKPLLIDEYEDVQEAAINAFSRFKKWLNVDEIIMGLSDKNPILRRNSAMLLGLIGAETAIETLGVTLKDSDVRVRTAVVEALGSIDTPLAMKFLLLSLSDESSDVRKSAVFAISRIGTDEVVEPLILLLYDIDAMVRSTAAKALGNIKNKKAIEPLIRLLSDESGFVKTTAIEALGNFKEKRVKNVLIKLLTDKDAEIRATAIESLSIFDGVAHNITPLLKDKEWSVRKKAVDVLGKFFKEESDTYLKKVADMDEDYQVRETALRYLAGERVSHG